MSSPGLRPERGFGVLAARPLAQLSMEPAEMIVGGKGGVCLRDALGAANCSLSRILLAERRSHGTFGSLVPPGREIHV
jgi:hypothetical protein